MYDFSEKYVVLTGCGKGIGKEIAKAFLENGVKKIAMLDYNEELIKASAKELDPEGTRAYPFVCNIGSYENVHETFEAIYKEFGRIDILVNNAGITRDHVFWKLSKEDMEQVMQVNFFGTYYCCAEVVPAMREQKYGRIISMSSTSAHGNVGQANYAASKAALNGFSKTLALELGRSGITVNTIEPGHIDTDMMRAIPKEKLEARIPTLPMQRLGTPREIANLCLFLASDEASYVSGENIICSGASKVI